MPAIPGTSSPGHVAENRRWDAPAVRGRAGPPRSTPEHNVTDNAVMAIVAFDRVQHLTRVPVRVAGESTRFLVDTGIGITVVSSAFAARSDVCPTGGTFTGRRMSGQVVHAPLVRLPALRVGDYTVDGHLAGVADLGSDHGPMGFSGILGPGFFEEHVVTTDPDEMTLTVEAATSADADGDVVRVDVRRDGPSVDPFAELVLPNGRTIWVEIDSGSANLILATRYLEDCGLQIDSPSLETTTGTDETGHRWTRRRATVTGRVHLTDAPRTAQENPRVQFQDIIHDGLIGTDYLERYRFSLDVTGARLSLSSRRAAVWP